MEHTCRTCNFYKCKDLHNYCESKHFTINSEALFVEPTVLIEDGILDEAIKEAVSEIDLSDIVRQFAYELSDTKVSKKKMEEAKKAVNTYIEEEIKGRIEEKMNDMIGRCLDNNAKDIEKLVESGDAFIEILADEHEFGCSGYL